MVIFGGSSVDQLEKTGEQEAGERRRVGEEKKLIKKKKKKVGKRKNNKIRVKK
jgi:hypothetical protein